MLVEHAFDEVGDGGRLGGGGRGAHGGRTRRRDGRTTGGCNRRAEAFRDQGHEEFGEDGGGMNALFLGLKQGAHALLEFGGRGVSDFRGGERGGQGNGFQMCGINGLTAQPQNTDASVNRGNLGPWRRSRQGC